mmetsp:Transcript_21368/g.45153  ORF Transcript_21368/g.45153 Transcript_21368/m.45153 type:complete len:232 (+) Transcript_21368:1196-1891(+)
MPRSAKPIFQYDTSLLSWHDAGDKTHFWTRSVRSTAARKVKIVFAILQIEMSNPLLYLSGECHTSLFYSAQSNLSCDVGHTASRRHVERSMSQVGVAASHGQPVPKTTFLTCIFVQFFVVAFLKHTRFKMSIEEIDPSYVMWQRILEEFDVTVMLHMPHGQDRRRRRPNRLPRSITYACIVIQILPYRCFGVRAIAPLGIHPIYHSLFVKRAHVEHVHSCRTVCHQVTSIW